MIQQVNLYTDELRPRHEPLQASTALLAVVVALALVIASATYVRYELSTRQDALAELNAELVSVEARVGALTAEVESQRIDPGLTRALDDVAGRIERRRRLLEEVERLVVTGEEGFSPYLSAMARQVPADVWLTGFRINLDRAEIGLTGRARSGNRVPLYLERLGDEAVFQGRQFERFELERHESGQWIDFNVATRREPGDAS